MEQFLHIRLWNCAATHQAPLCNLKSIKWNGKWLWNTSLTHKCLICFVELAGQFAGVIVHSDGYIKLLLIGKLIYEVNPNFKYIDKCYMCAAYDQK